MTQEIIITKTWEKYDQYKLYYTTGKKYSTDFLLQEISLQIQRGNVASIMKASLPEAKY